jgi:hypothetical protein
MSRIGIDDAIAEPTLGHKGAKIERTYNRDKRTVLKREALAKLAAEIVRIVGEPIVPTLANPSAAA